MNFLNLIHYAHLHVLDSQEMDNTAQGIKEGNYVKKISVEEIEYTKIINASALREHMKIIYLMIAHKVILFII